MDNLSKSNKRYGIQFYRKSKISAHDVLLENLQVNEILVHKHTTVHGREWGITRPDNLVKIVSKNKYLYEILPTNRKRKLYFDIDVVANGGGILVDTLEACRSVLKEHFQHADLQISGSKTEAKISYHIILSNWVANNVEEMSCLKEFCIKWHHLGFDDKVYTSNRAMKLVNQSKPDGRVQEIIEGSEISKHFITCFFDDNSFHISQSAVFTTSVADQIDIDEEIEITNNVDIADFPQLDLVAPSTFNFYDQKTSYLSKLNIIPLYKRGEQYCLRFHDIIRIQIWAKQVGLSFEQFWNWNKQKDDSLKRQIKYRNFWDSRNWYINENLIEAILLRFYPNITKHIATRIFIENFDYINNNNLNIKKVDGMFLNSSCLNPCSKYTILGSPMGSNKTGTIISSLKNKKCLMITSRITLAKNVSNRMMEEGLNFINYKDFESKSKFDGILRGYDNVVCGIASLHYLFDNTFDVIVMDESESLLNTFIQNAETHQKFLGSNWTILKHFITNANKVYLMDAFTTKLTVDFIKGIDCAAQIDYIDTNPSDLQKFTTQRTMIQHETYNDWIFEIIKSLKDGKKLFIFTCFKSNKKGVNALTNMLIQQFGWVENQDFIAYHGDKSKEKKALGSCEEIWSDSKVKCVITNSCITIGVNFNKKYVFDQIFCLYNSFVGARDVIQALFRIRHPKSTEMHFVHDKSKYRPDYSAPLCTPPDCDIYRNLQMNLNIEYFANDYECGLDTFKYFGTRANIVFDKKLRHTARDSNIMINGIMKKANVHAKWDSIRDITREEMKQISGKLNSDDGNMQMRLEFNKFFFKRNFETVEDA